MEGGVGVKRTEMGGETKLKFVMYIHQFPMMNVLIMYCKHIVVIFLKIFAY